MAANNMLSQFSTSGFCKYSEVHLLQIDSPSRRITGEGKRPEGCPQGQKLCPFLCPGGPPSPKWTTNRVYFEHDVHLAFTDYILYKPVIGTRAVDSV